MQPTPTRLKRAGGPATSTPSLRGVREVVLMMAVRSACLMILRADLPPQKETTSVLRTTHIEENSLTRTFTVSFMSIEKSDVARVLVARSARNDGPNTTQGAATP